MMMDGSIGEPTKTGGRQGRSVGLVTEDGVGRGVHMGCIVWGVFVVEGVICIVAV